MVLYLGIPVYREFPCLKNFPLHYFQNWDCLCILAHNFGIGLLLLMVHICTAAHSCKMCTALQLYTAVQLYANVQRNTAVHSIPPSAPRTHAPGRLFRRRQRGFHTLRGSRAVPACSSVVHRPPAEADVCDLAPVV